MQSCNKGQQWTRQTGAVAGVETIGFFKKDVLKTKKLPTVITYKQKWLLNVAIFMGV
jgi:hypothetical protein